MLTSHVGSFPLDPFKDAEERILRDLYDIGLDVPPYPQLRSFIDIYIEPLVERGLVEKKGGFYFADREVLINAKPPSIDIPEARKTVEVIKSLGLKFKGIRAPVTGAFTLSSRIYFDDPSKGLRATMLSVGDVVYSFFKEYVRNAVEFMKNLGYTFIVLDEPILGVIVGKRRILYGHTEDSIISLLDYLYKFTGSSVKGIHVCGRISDKLFDLLSRVSRLNVLNFEFKDSPDNIKVIQWKLLEEYDKILAPGIVSSKKPIVEGLDETRNLLRKIVGLAKGRVDYVSGDCGFGGLKGALNDPWQAYDIALKKLKLVVNVVKDLSKNGY